MSKAIFRKIFSTAFTLVALTGSAVAQQVYFVDGYHGGVYGHYPKQYTAFINETLERNPRWFINLEIEPETWDSVAVNEPANFQRFKELIADQSVSGRIEYVNPAYGQPYFYNINGESIIRQLGYGIQKLRQHFPNLVFTTYSTEEPCFTSALPQVLKSFGFEYASLKNPNTCWGGYVRNYGGEMINWKGPDGTLLPTVPRYASEALDKRSTWQTTASTNSTEYLDAAFKAGIANPVGMCLQDAGWKNGPWLGERPTQYPTAYTTWRNYIKNVVKQRDLADWRLTQEDIQVSLVWGSQVLQQIAKQVRYSENKIGRAEKIATLASLLKGADYPAADFDEAWRQIMLTQHHDCWIVPYNGGRNDTWIDKVQRWTDSANNIASRSIQSAFAAFGQDNENASLFARLFNGNADEWNGYVHLKIPAGSNAAGIIVKDNKGITLPSQFIKDRNELIVKAAVPGTGLRLLQLVNTNRKSVAASLISRKQNGTVVLETDLYKITIDPSKGGAITSLIAKQLKGKEFIDPKKAKGLNELKGYFFRDSNFFSSAATSATIDVLYDGALSASVEVKGSINSQSFSQVITVYKTDPLIDVKLRIDWKGNPGIGDDYKQAGGYKGEDYRKAFYDDRKKLQTLLPLNLAEERIYKNAPFDVIESKLSDTYFRTWDSIRNNVLLNWIDVTDKKGDYGFALYTDHTTAYAYAANEPLGLVTQYSGVGLWGRDYSIAGPTELHYAFYPHAGDWKKAGVWSSNVSWNNGVEAHVFNGSEDAMADISMFSITQKGFELTAMERKGNDLLIRLFNPSDAARTARLDFTGQLTDVEEQELDGRVIRKVKVNTVARGNSIDVPMRGFGLSTLVVKDFKRFNK
ncbi:MAG: hypothetical protein DI535_00380 [Citrobacter freundii]|nr:MAG: hypothetical protein DI535_00380 [Citrobacter freundii]